ncbi:hypothetical protein C7476_103199 [Phyllobacterium bourgognense]|uniref:Uncharacterized protein n=1 Tax=Phyllobacterium bourgognense TaxID=314236 RepID=A0A368Z296_9HYPH|nr:hypothetical protein C7476_103199 [Phyllobacterium bourgognense]
MMRHSLTSAFAALVLYGLGTMTSMAASPSGRFCGEMISSGDYRDVETILNVARDGHLSGTYVFDEPDGRVEGNLVEKELGSGTSRTLVWTDKYGTGLLSLDFSSDFNGFNGSWGGSLNGKFDATSHPWNGARCGGLVS